MSWSRRYEGPEPQRVNRWLATEGVCSRREAEALIKAGRVLIDGTPLSEPGHKINPGETLTIRQTRGDQTRGGATSSDPTALPVLEGATYVINKPIGIVSAQPEPGQVPAARLLSPDRAMDRTPPPGSRASLAPLGRLDRDSRGLLLLSTDGVLAKAVIGPDSRLDKEYEVVVRGRVEPRKLALLRHGLSLDGRQLRPAHVEPVGPGELIFILNEGRYRQIRRMCEAVELEVIDLRRVRIGPLWLGDLPEGAWRGLTTRERQGLIEASRVAG
jgi:23S rRNA pseudouridine2604 synthase